MVWGQSCEYSPGRGYLSQVSPAGWSAPDDRETAPFPIPLFRYRTGTTAICSVVEKFIPLAFACARRIGYDSCQIFIGDLFV